MRWRRKKLMEEEGNRQCQRAEKRVGIGKKWKKEEGEKDSAKGAGRGWRNLGEI
jgi:hypothetical protein